MKFKKAQTNQVFVYLLSIIIILFIGFLVTRFVISFGDDAKDLTENKFFEQIEQDYDSVYKSYGSEKVLTYRVSNKIELVCFAKTISCIDSLNELNEISNSSKEEMKISVSAGDNIVLFDNVGITMNRNIGEFEVENNCFCKKPNNGRFELIWENQRNTVYLRE